MIILLIYWAFAAAIGTWYGVALEYWVMIFLAIGVWIMIKVWSPERKSSHSARVLLTVCTVAGFILLTGLRYVS